MLNQEPTLLACLASQPGSWRRESSTAPGSWSIEARKLARFVVTETPLLLSWRERYAEAEARLREVSRG